MISAGSIYLTGDLHGNALGEMRKLSKSRFKGSKGDFVIILGDFGFLFNTIQTKEEKYWLAWLNKAPWTTLFLDGNHENFELLNNLSTENMFGSDVGKVSDSIFHLRRGGCYSIFNKTFFVMGGAISIDKHLRKPYVDWWPEEEPSFSEWNTCIKNATQIKEVDYILTHEIPSCVYHELDYGELKIKNSVSEGVQVLKDTLKYEWGYSGHHHFDQDYPQHKWSILYNGIVEIKGIV